MVRPALAATGLSDAPRPAAARSRTVEAPRILPPTVADRHARQALLPGVGAAGNLRLAGAKVLVVGLGGLGSPAALYLAGAGVGTLGLCDFDKVEATNLHRQPLYTLADVGRAKVDAACQRLAALDPGLDLVPLRGQVGVEGAGGIVAGWDVVLDCTDDVEARYALSDACVAARIPLVHAAVSRWEGECTVFLPPGPCYRCVHPVPPTDGATCATEGVMGTVPGLLGTMQAQEALKLVLGVGTPLVGRMQLLDGLSGESRTIALKRREGCLCTMSPVACPLPWAAPAVPAMSATEYEARKGELFLLDVREPDEFEEVRMPGATLIPLGELPQRMGELPKGKTIVCQCAVGGRSARATEMLRSRGFDAVNLAGGIRAWLMMQP